MNKLFILCGIPFSGKSTLAKTIADKLGYTRIDLDEIKLELFGNSIKDSELKQEDWDSIYQKMYEEIHTFLSQGKTVVHDTGNFTKHERALVRELAKKLNVETITIFVDTPKAIAYERLLTNRKTKERFDVVDEDFENAVKEMEPPTREEKFLVFDSNNDLDSWIDENL